MSLEDKLRYEVRRILLGPTDLPQACDLALHNPQSEISVWLHGMGEPRDADHAPLRSLRCSIHVLYRVR